MGNHALTWFCLSSFTMLILLIWICPQLTISCIVAGTLAFFGVRHLFENHSEVLKRADDLLTKLLYGLQDLPKKTKQRSRHRTSPWAGILISNKLNDALEAFVNQLLSRYVNVWYSAQISSDSQFLVEVKLVPSLLRNIYGRRYQLRFAAATSLKTIKSCNLEHLLENVLLPATAMHISKFMAKRSGSLTEDANEWCHFAVESEENYETYMRNIADLMVEAIFDETRIGGLEVDAEAPIFGTRRWPSESCRHVIREIIYSTILTPAIEFITSPQSINRLIIKAGVERENVESISEDLRVPILCKLGDCNSIETPDSLLTLSLKELMRSPKLLQGFREYLKDIRGPVNSLDIFVDVDDLLHRLHRGPEEQADISAAISDSWLLYERLSAIDTDFSSSSCQVEFLEALLAESLPQLTKACEQVYSDFYQMLGHNYVVLFCQSESYLASICGSSPEALDFFAASPEVSSRRSPSTRTPDVHRRNTFSHHPSRRGSDADPPVGNSANDISEPNSNTAYCNETYKNLSQNVVLLSLRLADECMANWIISRCIIGVFKVFPSLLNNLFHQSVRKFLSYIITEDTAFTIVKSLHANLFEKTEEPTKSASEDVSDSRRILVRLLRHHGQGVHHISESSQFVVGVHDCLQDQKRNKQLACILLDLIVEYFGKDSATESH